jgi:hypothetical protein
MRFYDGKMYMFPIINTDLLPYLNQPAIVSIQPQKCNQDCPWDLLLEAVQNDKLHFREEEIIVRSYRPISIGLPPRPLLDFKTIIENPPELIQLSNINDIRIFDELLRLLNYRKRAWTANILIGKMMVLHPYNVEVEVLHNKFENYDLKSVDPEKWWEVEGKTLRAKKAWITYIRKVKPTMKWHTVELDDAQKYSYFRHTTPSGIKIL